MKPSIIYTVSLYAAFSCGVILCICSFLFCFRRRNPRYMRSFPLYTTLSLVPSGLIELLPDYENLIYFIFSNFELLYFTYFLTRLFTSKRATSFLWTLCATWVITCIALAIWGRLSMSVMGINGVTIIGECIIIIIGCIEYIREIMAARVIPNLAKDPSFWMVCATLCYFVTLIPTMIFTVFARESSPGSVYTGAIVWSANNYAQLISAALYITAMLCTKNRQSLSSLA